MAELALRSGRVSAPGLCSGRVSAPGLCSGRARSAEVKMSLRQIKGKVWKFGDNVNTDEIIPAKYLNVSDDKELAKHCMTGISESRRGDDKQFGKKISKGDVIVAGENFGCGSSREHAPLAIKAAGISCVIASSFARIFFRNSINIGLPILECKNAARIHSGDIVKIDLANGIIDNLTQKKIHRTSPFPSFMQEIVNAGGLMKKIKKGTGYFLKDKKSSLSPF